MNWFFFIDIRTDLVVAIVMSDGYGAPLTPQFGHRTFGNTKDSYWQLVDKEALSEFLQAGYEIYIYDENSEGGDEIWTGEWDSEDELAWEIPPIQSWVKGTDLSKEYIASVSNFVGIGSMFTYDDIAQARKFSRDQVRQGGIASPVKAELQSARCLWCKIPIERKYNFYIYHGPLNQPVNFEDFEDPLVWVDGVITERTQRESDEIFPNHYGDSVVECLKCGAAFLASQLEQSHPRRVPYPDQENWQISDSVVLAGSCLESAQIDSGESAGAIHASLQRTLDFLAKATEVGRSTLSWAEWTAIQQAANWITHLDRNAKLTGKVYESSTQTNLIPAMARFIEETDALKIGTLGSLSPFRDLHSREVCDENFRVHNFEIQERHPIANMSRISGVSRGWARPDHPALRESDLMMTGWSEFDKWIALRGKLIVEAERRGIKDWAIAIDMKGNLVS